MSEELCPICNENNLKGQPKGLQDGVFESYDCKRCGQYKISRDYVHGNIFQIQPDIGYLVSAWCRRENNRGRVPTIAEGETTETISNGKWLEQFENMGFPKAIDEKLNKLLQVYDNKAGNYYNIEFQGLELDVIAEAAVKDQRELIGLRQILAELNFISDLTNTGRTRITGKGWMRVNELRKEYTNSNTAFIAMWYDKTTEEYQRAVIAAVQKCGFKPVIVNREEFSNFIMDEVITFIRQSRFLIADFTAHQELDSKEALKTQQGVRGGVYWEAGMAFGLGRPVIHTCEDALESKRRVHFDVDQFNTIYWRNEELSTEIRDLSFPIEKPIFAERLAIRILHLVGKGSG